jgi:hypothetical protein
MLSYFVECFRILSNDFTVCILQEHTNMFSPVPNGEQLEDGEVSAGGSVDEDHVDDSEDHEDDSEESEDEVPSPPRNERHSKKNQDLEAVPSKTVASSTRSSKRGRAATPESTEKAAKQPKPDVPKPRKALPRIKIQVPVAST